MILFLIGAILFKFLNLNEGLSISGWVRYYFINKYRTIDPKLCDTEPLDNYDPLTPATQPDNDNENIMLFGPWSPLDVFFLNFSRRWHPLG